MAEQAKGWLMANVVEGSACGSWNPAAAQPRTAGEATAAGYLLRTRVGIFAPLSFAVGPLAWRKVGPWRLVAEGWPFPKQVKGRPAAKTQLTVGLPVAAVARRLPNHALQGTRKLPVVCFAHNQLLRAPEFDTHLTRFAFDIMGLAR